MANWLESLIGYGNNNSNNSYGSFGDMFGKAGINAAGLGNSSSTSGSTLGNGGGNSILGDLVGLFGAWNSWNNSNKYYDIAKKSLALQEEEYLENLKNYEQAYDNALQRRIAENYNTIATEGNPNPYATALSQYGGTADEYVAKHGLKAA